MSTELKDTSCLIVKDDEGSEEGEIVDSDEERNVRLRIKELEARNDELEKIEELGKITGDFTNQYSYASDMPCGRNIKFKPISKQSFMSQKDVARIPSDASSISSDELLPTVKKRTKRKGHHHSRKGKDQPCNKCRSSRSIGEHKHHTTHRSKMKSENKFLKSLEHGRKYHHKLRSHKMKSPLALNENYLETISLDSDEDSDHYQKKTEKQKSDFDGPPSNHLNRAELRFALARDRTNANKTTGNLLKERLYYGNTLLDHKENINTTYDVGAKAAAAAAGTLDFLKSKNNCKLSNLSEQSIENSDKDDDDDCATQEEQELRLIALKSAILKKHLARKKRNAEMAYSPTDFAPVPANSIIPDDNMEVVEEELDELNDVMEISPINSPKLDLSPLNDENLSQCDLKDSGDNNSIDMDIAHSGSEEEDVDNNRRYHWYPIDSAPITLQPMEEQNDSLKYPLPIHYGIYVPEMRYQFDHPNSPNMIHNKDTELLDNNRKPPLIKSCMNMYNNFMAGGEEPPPPPSMCYPISDDDSAPPSQPKTTLGSFSDIFNGIKFNEEPPPPPPFFNEKNKNMTKAKVFQRLGAKTDDNDWSDKPLKEMNMYSFSENQNPNPNHNQNDVNTTTVCKEEKDSDDEASALRAVLLSKLQASKSQKKEHKAAAELKPEPILQKLEIECYTEENSSNNSGLETVLQKALKRLKSNFNSPSLSSNENDDSKLIYKAECTNEPSILMAADAAAADSIDISSDRDDRDESNQSHSIKSPEQLEKTDVVSLRNTIMEEYVKNMSSTNSPSNVNESTNICSSPLLVACTLNHIEENETHSSPSCSIPDQDQIGQENIVNEQSRDSLSTRTDTNDSADFINRDILETEAKTTDTNITDMNQLCEEIADKEEIIPNRKIINHKAKTIKPAPAPPPPSSISKNPTTSNENIKVNESTLKEKTNNSVVAGQAQVSIRAQPLSVKNNLIKPSSVSTTAKSAQNNYVQSTLDKIRTTRTTKIVRPNKVINKEITMKLKRAITPSHSPTPTPPSKVQRLSVNKSTNSTANVSTSNNTVADVAPKITVKKLIINLRASDTESSDNELVKDLHLPAANSSSIERLKNNHNEIASPLELLMNSGGSGGDPTSTCKSSLSNENSTSTTSLTIVKTPTANSAFEKKLDAFLKGIRRKGSLEITPAKNTKNSPVKSETAKNMNTPSAVRHLPLASQDEYKRLIHRMKLLEKQKQSKKSDDDAAAVLNTPTATPTLTPKKSSGLKNSTQSERESEKAEADNTKEASKRSMQMKTLLLYENSFQLTSDNIVRLLNKSLNLVHEAKKAKIAKLQHEQKLQELREEMARLQLLYDQEERKFSCMKPQIGASNQFLTTLKKKRRSLMENANKLGKSLKGDYYRINNKGGEEIIAKSRKLHAEIKLVNSLRADNINTLILQNSKCSKNISVVKDTNDVAVQIDQITQEPQDNNVKQHVNTAESPESAIAIGVAECIDKEEEKDKKTENDVPPKDEGEDDSIVKTSETDCLNCIDGDQREGGVLDEGADKSENRISVRAEILEQPEMRVELEVQHQDNTITGEEVNSHSHMNENESCEQPVVIPIYKSPLEHFRREYRNIDVNAIVCPYEMWGKCADESCSYMHLTKEKERGTELALTASSNAEGD